MGDRRIEKTKKFLREALAALIAEKPYDAIVIQDILDRANVGRSTFYTHFRDKDDLLVSSIHGMIQSVRTKSVARSTIWPESILWFSLPIFEYHDAHRHDGRLAPGDRGGTIQHERLRAVLAEMIGAEVHVQFKARGKTVPSISPDLLAQYVASTFVLVLNWWVQSKNPLPSDAVDGMFRALVAPTLSTLFSGKMLLNAKNMPGGK